MYKKAAYPTITGAEKSGVSDQSKQEPKKVAIPANLNRNRKKRLESTL